MVEMFKRWLTHTWDSFKFSFDHPTILRSCSPLSSAVPAVTLGGFILFSAFNSKVSAAIGLTNFALPLAFIITAGIFSFASGVWGAKRPSLLAALQLVENALYATSFISLTANSDPPASYAFACLYSLSCLYWGLYFAFSILNFTALSVGVLVFGLMGEIDIMSMLVLAVGLVVFFSSSSLTANRRRQHVLATRSEDVLAKLEALIVEQNTTVKHHMQERCAILVHDLMNRLAPSYLDLEEALEITRESKSREFVSRSLKDVKQLIETMKGSLRQNEFGKQETSWFPLDELRDEAEQLAADRSDGVQIEVGELPRTFIGGQVDLITLSLRNLITNAIEASARTIKLTGRLSEDQCSVVLTVADDGPGLPPKVEKNLFKPYNTHGKSHGVGLGIYLTGQIIRATGGRIELAETGPKGTTFRIELPVFVSATAQLSAACAETPDTGTES
jgi:signal transduction histidine kinase